MSSEENKNSYIRALEGQVCRLVLGTQFTIESDYILFDDVKDTLIRQIADLKRKISLLEEDCEMLKIENKRESDHLQRMVIDAQKEQRRTLEANVGLARKLNEANEEICNLREAFDAMQRVILSRKANQDGA